MATAGDIAVLQFGNDGLWHYAFLTPTVTSTFNFVTAVGAPTLVAFGTQMSVDTGWTANSTVGDKTASLASYSNGLNGTMVSALNLASAGTGTAISAAFDVLVTVVKQLAATRTALVAAKLPNV